MYQVMIVDDEEPVLDSFSFIIGKDVKDFTLCGKARSGPEAVDMINELIPDLVFMDIQIPGIDGIEVIRQVRSQFPHIVFILATAYERFDIAQKAIPLGIFKYIVKPISRKALLDEFDRVKNHLDSLKDKDRQQVESIRLLEKTKSELKDRFLGSLIWGNPDEKSWAEISNIFSLSCSGGLLCLIEVSGEMSENSRKEIYKEINDRIQYKYCCLSTVVTGRMLIFFPQEPGMKNPEEALQKILDSCRKSGFVMGLGSVYPVLQLHRSFSEAFRPFSEAAEREKNYAAEKETVKKICRSILDPDNPDAEFLFRNYRVEIFNNKTFPVALGKMVSLFTLILEKFDTGILVVSNTAVDLAEEIMNLKSYDEWVEWSDSFLKQVRKVYNSNKSHFYPHQLSSAVDYIGKNYKKPLQLCQVADECGITGSYLSRLFKEHLGITFIDYLNRFRLKKAVILLEEKKYSIKEITFLVGYQDPNYFSRIFKRHMGISPSDLDKEGYKSEK